MKPSALALRIIGRVVPRAVFPVCVRRVTRPGIPRATRIALDRLTMDGRMNTNHTPAEISQDYYRFATDDVLTPALAVYRDAVEHNIATTLRLLGNDPERWRPHVKTAKLTST